MAWWQAIMQRLVTWGLASGLVLFWAVFANRAVLERPVALTPGVCLGLCGGAAGLAAITVLRPAWWSRRAHRRVMLPLLLSLVAPFVGLLPHWSAASGAMYRPGSRYEFMGGTGFLLSTLFAAAVLWWVHRQRHRPLFERVVRALGLGGACVLGALLFMGITKKVSHPSSGLDTLPSREVLGPMTTGHGTQRMERKKTAGPALDHDWTEVGSEAQPLSLHRVCNEGACWFAFRQVPGETSQFTLGKGAISMTSDEREGLFYLSDGKYTLVFLARTLQPLPDGVAQASGRLTVPWLWLAGAGVALALIGVLQACRPRAVRWAGVLAGASAGRVENGWIRFGDHRPDELAPPGFAPGSRVIVLSGATSRADHYRSSHSLAEGDVLRGSHGMLLEKAWANVTALDALCVAFAALAAAPLVAGAVLGLLL
jgi:hypothetical protein